MQERVKKVTLENPTKESKVSNHDRSEIGRQLQCSPSLKRAGSKQGAVSPIVTQEIEVMLPKWSTVNVKIICKISLTLPNGLCIHIYIVTVGILQLLHLLLLNLLQCKSLLSTNFFDDRVYLLLRFPPRNLNWMSIPWLLFFFKISKTMCCPFNPPNLDFPPSVDCCILCYSSQFAVVSSCIFYTVLHFSFAGNLLYFTTQFYTDTPR